MSRSSSLSQSGSWLEALRAFSGFHKQLQSPSPSASTTSSSTGPSFLDTAGRLRLYEQVAQAQLFGPPGYRISNDNLRVMRAVRWELLRVGSPRSQSVLLERILRLYTEASKALLYDPVPSQAERQALLLEQMQCLVEAKVSGVPLSVRHYRHPLQAPQLSKIGADLPLVLLQEMQSTAELTRGEDGRARMSTGAASSSSSPSSAAVQGAEGATEAVAAEAERRELVAAQLDCAVGLASSGYVDAALRLCTAEGFPYVIRQVAQGTRDGWKQAWALADAVPLPLLLAGRNATSPQQEHGGAAAAAAAEGASAGWLNGVLDAATRRYKATSDPAVREWVYSLMRVWTEEKDADKNDTGSRREPLPLRVMETYLAVCPASAWREAVNLVMCYNTTGSPFSAQVSSATPSAAKGSDGKEVAAERRDSHGTVAVGRLMTLLNVAQQPQEVLRLFYGSSFSAASLRASEAGAAECEGGCGDTIWRPSNEFLSTADTQHPASYNHAMMALAQLGYWRCAMRFYEHLPAPLTNRHTHWTAVRMFIQPHTSPSPAPTSFPSSPLPPPCSSGLSDAQATVPEYVFSEDVYQFCVGSLKRAWLADDASSTATTTADTRTTTFPEAESVFEGLALWAAARGDWRTTAWLSNHAPQSCRYIKLIALASVLAAYGGAGAADVKGHVRCVSPTVMQSFRCFSSRHAQHPYRVPVPRNGSRPREITLSVESPMNSVSSRGGAKAANVGRQEASERAVEVVRQLDALLSARDASVKQVCLALAFIANSAVAVQLLGSDTAQHSKQRDSSGDEKRLMVNALDVLRPEVVQAMVTVLGRHVNGSQDGLDHAIAIFMEQYFSLRQRQGNAKVRRQHWQQLHVQHKRDGEAELPTTKDIDVRAELLPSFKRARVLPEVMRLIEGIADNEDDGWRVALQVLTSLGHHQGLSIARAAPAMVSGGMKPEVAIQFLDS